MDTISTKRRSEVMALVRSKDTKPELVVRHLVFRLGFRFRLHYPGLPGKPDLVFPRFSKVIFVHGCFWHRHQGCKGCRMPKTRLEFWAPKLLNNARRDAAAISKLRRMGWGVMVIWECQTRSGAIGVLERRIKRFLG